MTIIQVYKKFVNNRNVYCAEKTLGTYDGHMQLFFAYLEKRYGKPAEEIDFDELPADDNIYSAYIIYLRGKGYNRNHGKKLRNTTIRSYCRTLKAFLRFGYEQDYCRDYLKGVKLPKDDVMPKLPLCQDEVAALDACFDQDTELGIRNYCIVHLMLDCGLRTEEVVHLQVAELIQDKNLIRILDSKGSKSRMTLIPGFLIQKVNRYLEMCGRDSGTLFYTRSGSYLTGNSIKQLFQDLKSQANIPRLHAHLCRHTFATSYLIGGGNLEFLRVFLGHTDYNVTKVYSSKAAEYKMLGIDIYKLDPIFFTRGY